MSFLPPDHPERLVLAAEVHARPPEPLDTLDDPSKCMQCTKTEECSGGSCDNSNCELCPGQTTEAGQTVIDVQAERRLCLVLEEPDARLVVLQLLARLLQVEAVLQCRSDGRVDVDRVGGQGWRGGEEQGEQEESKAHGRETGN